MTMKQRKVKRNNYYFLFSIRVSRDISYIYPGKLGCMARLKRQERVFGEGDKKGKA